MIVHVTVEQPRAALSGTMSATVIAIGPSATVSVRMPLATAV
jgi:hypothetical protein